MEIKKNYLYNLMLQIVTIIIPLITVPYISRVLKPEGVGTFAYTSSIIQYFILFGMLGINVYGNRTIATVSDNRIKLSKTFYSIYFLQLILTGIALVIYLIFVFFFLHNYRIIALLQGITLVAAAIDCSWLFSGLEQFKKIVIRNIFVKIVSLICIFVFVNNSNDLILYTVILGLSTLFGQLVMWISVKEYVSYIKISLKDIIKHLKPSLIYFLPQIAMQIYFAMDKTMLGIILGTHEVGIYDYADKILKIALSIVTSLGTVMLPRMSNVFASGDLKKADIYITKSLDFSTLIAIPIMFGLAGTAKEFIPWFLGDGFEKSALVLIALSPAILLMAWSGVFGTQYLIPKGRMKQYNISVYVGAIVNIIVNFILIKPFGLLGASISTLCAELAVIFIQLFFIKESISIKNMFSKFFYYFISGIIMFILLRLIGELMGSSILTSLIQIISGILIYGSLIIVFEKNTDNGLIINEISKISSRYKKL